MTWNAFTLINVKQSVASVGKQAMPINSKESKSQRRY